MLFHEPPLNAHFSHQIFFRSLNAVYIYICLGEIIRKRSNIFSSLIELPKDIRYQKPFHLQTASYPSRDTQVPDGEKSFQRSMSMK